MTDRNILALNPGSSSLKAAVRDPSLVVAISLDRLGTPEGVMHVADGADRPVTGGVAEAVDQIAAELDSRGLVLAAVGHRVVHGGPRHYLPTEIDDQLLEDLKAAIPLAPLHLPGDLEAIGHSRAAWPSARHIACFDTGFHHDLPERSRRLPVSEELAALGIRRYGFHGLSIQSVLHALPDLGGAVIAHLGSGCSVSAVADGRPRHTSMSFTPTSGTPSTTRSGDLDPEIVLFLIEEHGFTVERLRQVLDRSSGVAGIADGRRDMRDLLAADDAHAALAIDMFVTNIAMTIASCATTLDTWDSLVFTGGIGEHAEPIRTQILDRLPLAQNNVRVYVVPADEEAVIDRLTRPFLSS